MYTVLIERGDLEASNFDAAFCKDAAGHEINKTRYQRRSSMWPQGVVKPESSFQLAISRASSVKRLQVLCSWDL